MKTQTFKLINIITISFWIIIIHGEDLTTKGDFQALCEEVVHVASELGVDPDAVKVRQI